MFEYYANNTLHQTCRLKVIEPHLCILIQPPGNVNHCFFRSNQCMVKQWRVERLTSWNCQTCTSTLGGDIWRCLMNIWYIHNNKGIYYGYIVIWMNMVYMMINTQKIMHICTKQWIHDDIQLNDYKMDILHCTMHLYNIGFI